MIHRPPLRHAAASTLAALVAVGCTAATPTMVPTATPTATPAATGAAAADTVDADAEAASASLFVRPERELTDELLAAVASLPGVVAVTAPQRDDLALVGSVGPDGTPIDDFPEGFRVLVTATVAGEAEVAALGAGEVLLTGLGAALRDLPNGSTVRFGDHPGLVVAGRTDDAAVTSAEFVIHPDDAAAVGLLARERLFVGLDDDADPEAVADAVSEVLGDQAFVRIREPHDDDGRPFVLSLAQTKVTFGEFAFRDRSGTRDITQGQSWIDANIVTRTVPLLGAVSCHRAIIDDLTAALTAITDAGLASEIHPDEYAGCWYPRRTAPGGNLSKHAWGIALDINVDLSLPGGGEVPHPGVIRAFEDAGFRWGGEFPTPDNHHFEWVGQPNG